jgi:NhaA family Na+:H+ antiporter
LLYTATCIGRIRPRRSLIATTETTRPLPEGDAGLPVSPIERLVAPVRRFLHIEAASGVVLLVCAAVTLVLANYPAAGWFAALWKTDVSFVLGGLTIAGDVGHLVVNDGLMALFFVAGFRRIRKQTP